MDRCCLGLRGKNIDLAGCEELSRIKRGRNRKKTIGNFGVSKEKEGIAGADSSPEREGGQGGGVTERER